MLLVVPDQICWLDVVHVWNVVNLKNDLLNILKSELENVNYLKATIFKILYCRMQDGHGSFHKWSVSQDTRICSKDVILL